jgi:hypothetical protein
MRRLEAQVNGRRDGRVRTEDGVGELEEGVAPGVEALVERAAEALESIGRFHDAPIMHPPPAFRTPYLPAGLKRKLSSSSLLWICSRISRSPPLAHGIQVRLVRDNLPSPYSTNYSYLLLSRIRSSLPSL